MRQRHLKFGEWLQQLELLSAADLAAALQTQADPAQPPRYIGEILLAEGLISEAVRDGVLALQKLLGDSTRLAEMPIAPEVLRKIPPRFARDNAVLPLIQIDTHLVVALAQTDSDALLAELAALTGCRIYPLPYRAADILAAAQVVYDPRRASQAGMEWIHEALPMDGPLITFVGSGDAVSTGARNQTCIHVRSEESTFLIDCGPASLSAMKQLGLPPQQLQGILLTHAHGDHFGGVPYVLLEQVLAGRSTPFWVMGPAAVLERVQQWNELAFPKLFEQPPFELHWLEIEQEPRAIPGTGAMVYPFAMHHQRSLPCLGYQIHLAEEKIIAYTGDTAWCDNLVLLARDTDLLICECSAYDPLPEAVRHLSYQELLAHQAELRTRQLILTHLGQEMLDRAAQGEIAFECAFDGLTLDLSSRLD